MIGLAFCFFVILRTWSMDKDIGEGIHLVCSGTGSISESASPKNWANILELEIEITLILLFWVCYTDYIIWLCSYLFL